MNTSFDEVKRTVIGALYRDLYESDENEFFSLQEIKESTNLQIGLAFLRKAVEALVGELQVKAEFFDDERLERYTLTAKGISAAEKVLKALRAGEQRYDGVPASDRLVTLDDNQREEIVSQLTELQLEVKQSNEIGNALQDDKDRITSELESGQRLVAVGRLRLNALLALLEAPLRFLAEKFSGSAASELAKKLLVELWKVIGL